MKLGFVLKDLDLTPRNLLISGLIDHTDNAAVFVKEMTAPQFEIKTAIYNLYYARQFNGILVATCEETAFEIMSMSVPQKLFYVTELEYLSNPNVGYKERKALYKFYKDKIFVSNSTIGRVIADNWTGRNHVIIGTGAQTKEETQTSQEKEKEKATKKATLKEIKEHGHSLCNSL